MSLGLNVAVINIILCSLISYLSAPFFKNIGTKLNIIDLPDIRKVHKKPLVRIAGLSIFSTFFIYLFISNFFIDFGNFDSEFYSKFYLFLIGGLFFFLIGIHDDIFKSSPFLRLFLQFVVALFVSANGINFGTLNFYLPYFGQIYIALPNILNFIFSAFWIVSITNAINWLDGIDGLAGGYCGILSIGLLLITVFNGNILGILSFSIILGILIGFLIRNFRPAFYIMGDSGSNFLGYFFSASSLLFLPNSINGSIEIFYLLIIFSLPLGDMFLVILERFIKNQNIFLPDKNHIHHRLMNLNIGYNNIIFILFSYSALSISVGIFNLLNI